MSFNDTFSLLMVHEIPFGGHGHSGCMFLYPPDELMVCSSSRIDGYYFNKYTFEVNTKANKIQIKKAVEQLFNVKVESVSTLNSKPVVKRHGMKLYKTQAKKKAIVKLAQGNTITYFKEV